MKNPRIQLAIGIAISAVFLYLALRGVDPQDLWMAVRNFNWWWAIPFVAITMASMWVRAWRWRYFLLPTADLPTRRLWDPMMAGFALNGLLPARLGEFARPFLLARQENLPFPRIFGTIVVERIFDTLVLLGLLTYVFMTLEISPEISYPYSTKGELSRVVVAAASFIAGLLFIGIGWGVARRIKEGDAGRHITIISRSLLTAGGILALISPVLLTTLPDTITYGSSYEINGATLKQLSGKVAVFSVLLLAGSLLLVWPPACRLIQRIVHNLPVVPHGLRTGISKIVDTFAEGMQSLRSPRLIAIVTAQSIAVWMLVAWSMQIMPYGFEGMRAMTLSEATALTVITCLAILIPAAPGYWGLMELGIKFGMVILAVDTNPSRVLAYALIVHSLQYFPITGIGLISLWKSQVSMTELQQERPQAAAEA